MQSTSVNILTASQGLLKAATPKNGHDIRTGTPVFANLVDSRCTWHSVGPFDWSETAVLVRDIHLYPSRCAERSQRRWMSMSSSTRRSSKLRCVVFAVKAPNRAPKPSGERSTSEAKSRWRRDGEIGVIHERWHGFQYMSIHWSIHFIWGDHRLVVEVFFGIPFHCWILEVLDSLLSMDLESQSTSGPFLCVQSARSPHVLSLTSKPLHPLRNHLAGHRNGRDPVATRSPMQTHRCFTRPVRLGEGVPPGRRVFGSAGWTATTRGASAGARRAGGGGSK